MGKPAKPSQWPKTALLRTVESGLIRVRTERLRALAYRHRSDSAYSFARSGRVETQNLSVELHGVIATLDSVRKSILINSVLDGWSHWWNWNLACLVVAAALVARLRNVTLAGGVLILSGGAAVATWTWWRRPCRFDVARRLDSSAGLQDRISTALYFGDTANSGEMIKCQRQDAVANLGKLDVRSLFPIRMPPAARRSLALLLLAAAMFTYRMYYRPPLTALLQTTGMSRLMQSVLAPLKKTMEEVIQRPTSPADGNTVMSNESSRVGDSTKSGEDAFVSDKNAAATDDTRAPGSEQASEDLPSKGNGRSSLGQALLGALKQAFGIQPASVDAKRQAQTVRERQGSPGQADPAEGGDQREFQQGDDSKQKNPQGTANGAGDRQAGNKELKNSTPLSVKAVADRVALQSTNLKDQPRMDVSAEAGSAKIANGGNVLPRVASAVNGAEQEDVPARYRSYLQRYFQHADDAGSGTEKK